MDLICDLNSFSLSMVVSSIYLQYWHGFFDIHRHFLYDLDDFMNRLRNWYGHVFVDRNDNWFWNRNVNWEWYLFFVVDGPRNRYDHWLGNLRVR